MKQNLNQFFENNKNNRLDSHTKNFLYSKISHQVHKKSLFSESFVKRSKLISVSFIIALFFSTLQYSITKTDFDGVFTSYLKTIQTAQADYIGSVVSWDGSYQIILDNKVVNTSQTNNRIPDGGSILIKDGSKVLVKTNNNATANIVGPAKITFQKQNNQLVVDIAYIDHMDIKKDKTSSQTNTNEELVVKTDSKTIVAKSNTRDISLVNNGENNVIKNNNGELAITSNLNNSIIALQTDESIILDDEVKLFSIQKGSSDSLKTQNTTSANTSLKNDFNDILKDESVILTLNKETPIDSNLDKADTATLLKSTSVEENIGSRVLLSGISSKEDSINNSSQTINTQITADIVGSLSTTSQENILVDEEKNIIESDNSLTFMQESIKQNTGSTGVSTSLDVILVSKKLLTPELLQLLKSLNTNYYQNNKDLFKVSDIIKQLCDELKITCTQKDLLYDLNKVNQKLVEGYIITSDIKLIR